MWLAEAPSNIALIKYMGKMNGNISLNKSLSYTLHSFITRVEMEIIDESDDKFIALENVGFLKLEISDKAISRFKTHLQFLKNEFGCTENFIIKSGNNFPNDAGIASSASSFAALTMCAVGAFCDLKKICVPSVIDVSKLSRIGSGSSCRSFFSPWSVWEGEEVNNIDIPYKNLQHRIALVNASPKKVSSSSAHEFIQTSLLFEGRRERANKRFDEMISAMNASDWHKIFSIAWAEFFDMHALFETSENPFGYIESSTIKILEKVRQFWENHNDGPVATIDAGPNVHFLWREDQNELMEKFSYTCDVNLL